MLREALAESLHLRDAAVLDAGAVGELAELVLAVHVVDEVVAELLDRHLGVRHVLGDLGVVRGDHRLACGGALVDLVLGGQAVEHAVCSAGVPFVEAWTHPALVLEAETMQSFV